MRLRDDIMRRYDEGETPAEIAKVYNTTAETIERILGLIQ